MLKTREVVRRIKPIETEEIVVAVLCNVCGKRTEVEENSFGVDYHSLVAGGGWITSFPPDGVDVHILVCGPCLEAWCNTFKIPVEMRGWIYPLGEPLEAIHSETLGVWEYKNSTCWPKGQQPEVHPTWWDDSEGDFTTLPSLGVYRHFKGGQYEVLGYLQGPDSPEFFVLYQGLEGISKTWLRLVSSWNSEVDGQARFTRIV